MACAAVMKAGLPPRSVMLFTRKPGFPIIPQSTHAEFNEHQRSLNIDARIPSCYSPFHQTLMFIEIGHFKGRNGVRNGY